MQTNNDTAPPWHFWSAERKSLCGVPVGYPQRFTDRLADVTCADCRSRMQKVESASTPMQTDETRVREIAGYLTGLAKVYRAFPHAELWGRPEEAEYAASLTDEASGMLVEFANDSKKPELTPAEFVEYSIGQLQRVGLAFAAPPAVERGQGLTEIAHAIADGFTNGNEQFGESSPEQQARYLSAALAVHVRCTFPTPTLHPSDRDAIAQEVERARADERERCAALVDSHVPAPAGGPFSHTNSMRVVLIDAAKGIRARSAILALSGSLAPANGQVMPECICPKCGLRHGGGGPIDGGF